ncbi:hypothetical protein Celal_0248 [Cellulophaga algicola DSM 14237]|uniref:Uncharacterized protein n=1 Tax=Cellulophaga algicola (strain DSM 14237 / IC166 / ACAM 630) TaxID=688270 RepID=E6X8K7_CELAD|nr:hypothetical protein Celal_0248 [Cellulophaga algicola DSM 14237]
MSDSILLIKELRELYGTDSFNMGTTQYMRDPNHNL